jgi:flagellar biosynthesis/type III secretory pathway chaperone
MVNEQTLWKIIIQLIADVRRAGLHNSGLLHQLLFSNVIGD